MGQLQPTSKTSPAVFACTGRSFSISDVIDAAHFRGEVQSAWERLLAADIVSAEARDHEVEPDGDALQEMSDEFRSERDLITAEETEQWLAQRDLTLDDFSDYIVRRYWGGSSSARTYAGKIEFGEAPVELRDLLAVDVLLSGEFDKMATALSWRVAARAAAAAGSEPGREQIEAERARFLQRARIEDGALPEWLEVRGRDSQWLEEMLELEAGYGRECAALITEDRCRAEMASCRLQLTRLDVEYVELESQDAAREALFCVRTDGLSLEEVAAEGAYPYQRDRVLVEDLPEAVQERLLCAVTGEVIEPISRGDGFQVCRILEKIEPTLDDADSRRRIEQRLLQRAFSELGATHLRWSIPVGSNA